MSESFNVGNMLYYGNFFAYDRNNFKVKERHRMVHKIIGKTNQVGLQNKVPGCKNTWMGSSKQQLCQSLGYSAHIQIPWTEHMLFWV